MPAQPLENLFNPILKAPLRTSGVGLDGKLFAGRTVINSSAALFETISTPHVTSGDLIMLGFETSVVSNRVRGVKVDSVVDGVSFAVVSDLAPCTGGIVVNWLLIKST